MDAKLPSEAHQAILDKIIKYRIQKQQDKPKVDPNILVIHEAGAEMAGFMKNLEPIMHSAEFTGQWALFIHPAVEGDFSVFDTIITGDPADIKAIIQVAKKHSVNILIIPQFFSQKDVMYLEGAEHNLAIIEL